MVAGRLAQETQNTASSLTAVLEDPDAYGRVLNM